MKHDGLFRVRFCGSGKADHQRQEPVVGLIHAPYPLHATDRFPEETDTEGMDGTRLSFEAVIDVAWAELCTPAQMMRQTRVAEFRLRRTEADYIEARGANSA